MATENDNVRQTHDRNARIVRVLRVIEYTGPASAVMEQVERSLHGVKRLARGVVIRAATVGTYPEILEVLTEDDEAFGKKARYESVDSSPERLAVGDAVILTNNVAAESVLRLPIYWGKTGVVVGCPDNPISQLYRVRFDQEIVAVLRLELERRGEGERKGRE